MTPEILKELYVGRTDYYGRYVYTEGYTGHSYQPFPVTARHYAEHIAGTLDLGVYPLHGDATCRFAAIDLDEQDLPGVERAVKAGRDKGIHFFVAKSRQKGYHLYCFFQSSRPARSVREALRSIANETNLKKYDLFPRQDELGKSKGNYISLPCFGANRPFVFEEPSPPSCYSEWTPELAAHGEHVRVCGLVPVRSGEAGFVPKPCLVKEIENGTDEGSRNHVGVRIASDFDSETLLRWNSASRPPLGDKEIGNLAVRGGSYDFGCRDEVLSRLCLYKGRQVECPAYLDFVTKRKYGGNLSNNGHPVGRTTNSYDRILVRPSPLKRYVDAHSRCSEAPDIFWEFSAIAAGGALLSPDTRLYLGEERINTNIWLMLVAPSSRFHKSTVCKRARDTASVLTSGSLTISGDFTTEGLLARLAANQRALIYFDEFSRFLSDVHSKSYMSGADAILTELFDHHPFYTVTRKGEGTMRIKEPVVSLIGATTMDTFMGNSREAEWAGGFLARFVILPAVEGDLTRSLDFPPSLDFDERNGILNDFRVVCEAKREAMTVSPQAKEFYAAWRKEYLSRYGDIPVFGGTYSRMTVFALKAASVISVFEGNATEVGLEAMTSGCKMATVASQRFSHLTTSKVAFDPSSALRKRILETLRVSGGPLLQKELLRRMDVDTSVMSRAVETLVQQGYVSKGLIRWNDTEYWAISALPDPGVRSAELKAVPETHAVAVQAQAVAVEEHPLHDVPSPQF